MTKQTATCVNAPDTSQANIVSNTMAAKSTTLVKMAEFVTTPNGLIVQGVNALTATTAIGASMRSVLASMAMHHAVI